MKPVFPVTRLTIFLILLIGSVAAMADRWSERSWADLSQAERQQMMRERSQAISGGGRSEGGQNGRHGDKRAVWQAMTRAERLQWLAEHNGNRVVDHPPDQRGSDGIQTQHRVRIYQGLAQP